MLLRGQNGNEFELAFTSERLAEVQDRIDGDRWATVSFRVATPDVSWEESAPCLNLFAFETLANWLEAVASRDSDATLDGTTPVAPTEDGEAEIELPEPINGDLSEVEILEPELKFSVSQQFRDAVTIRVGFHLEDRPEEYNVDTDTDEALFVDLHMSREKILLAAQELRSSLEDLRLLQQRDPQTWDSDEDDAALLTGFEENPTIVTRLVDESAPLEGAEEGLEGGGEGDDLEGGEEA